MAPGSCSVVVEALARLVHVLPPSAETCTNPKSHWGSVSHFVSKVRLGSAAGTVTWRMAARSRLSPTPENSAGSPAWSGGSAATVQPSGSGGRTEAPSKSMDLRLDVDRYLPS